MPEDSLAPVLPNRDRLGAGMPRPLRVLSAQVHLLDDGTGQLKEGWFQGWREGEKEAFQQASLWLWENLYPTIYYRVRFQGLGDPRCRGVVEDSFQRALEEVDLLVSGGRFLTFPVPGRPGYREGCITGLIRKIPDSIEWRGSLQFRGDFRNAWTREAIRTVAVGVRY